MLFERHNHPFKVRIHHRSTLWDDPVRWWDTLSDLDVYICADLMRVPLSMKCRTGVITYIVKLPHLHTAHADYKLTVLHCYTALNILNIKIFILSAEIIFRRLFTHTFSFSVASLNYKNSNNNHLMWFACSFLCLASSLKPCGWTKTSTMLPETWIRNKRTWNTDKWCDLLCRNNTLCYVFTVCAECQIWNALF